VVALIQARSNSERLPGKYKMTIGKLSITELLYRTVIGVIPNTYFVVPKADTEIQAFLDEKLIPWFSGAFEPLARYWEVAQKLRAENVIRITGDCPALDPAVLFYLINLHSTLRADFTSNAHPVSRTEIDGNDVEIMSEKCLRWLNEYAKGADREHVTAHLYANPKYANKENLRCLFYNPQINLMNKVKTSIDTIEDLETLRSIYAAA
jgi:spore coat polysaccharide biosynthesis protein SpsF (cytidylyltransferase family)